MTAAPVPPSPASAPRSPSAIPLLHNGDRLTRAEFERRYHAMPHLRVAELVEGVVFMPSPTRIDQHGGPQADLAAWARVYAAATPGTQAAVSPTVRLDQDNEPQPDVLLRLSPDQGGRSTTSADGYVEGSPELAIEITASTASYDLHDKKRAYRRNGVRENLVWLMEEGRVVWWELREGEYVELAPDAQGHLHSRVFPGLWLDVPALLAGDFARVLATLQLGLASPERSAWLTRTSA